MGANSNLHPIRPLKSQRPRSASQASPQKKPRAGGACASRGQTPPGAALTMEPDVTGGTAGGGSPALSLGAVWGLNLGSVSHVLCLHMLLTSKIKGEPGFLALL